MKFNRRHSIETIEKEIKRQLKKDARLNTRQKMIFVAEPNFPNQPQFVMYMVYRDWNDLLKMVNADTVKECGGLL